MAVRLASLKATAELDAQKYVAGARQVDDANKRMSSSQAGVKTSMSQTQARTSESARSFDRYRQSIDPAYRAQERLATGTARLNAALARGQITAASHANGMALLQAKYGAAAASTGTLTAATGGLTTAFFKLQYIIGALGVGAAARQFVQLGEVWRGVRNELLVSGVAADQLQGNLDKLFASAQRNSAEIGSLATLYGRLNQAASELGASQEDMLRFVDGVAVALKVQGGDATKASGALLQLSQAMGSAIVRSEEYNSINEGARPILIAVAKGLDDAGGSVSKLRKLVVEGKVSSEAFFRAFLAGADELQTMADRAEARVSQSWTRMQNSLARYVGEVDSATGVSRDFMGALEGVSAALDDPQAFQTGIDNVNGLKTAFSEMMTPISGVITLVRELGEALANLAPGGTLGVLDGARKSAIDALETFKVQAGLTAQSFIDNTIGQILPDVGGAVNRGIGAAFGFPGGAAAPEASAELGVQKAITEEVKKTGIALGDNSKARDKAASKAERERKRQEEADARQFRSMNDYIVGLEEEARLSGLSVEVRREEEAVLRGMAIVQRFLTEEEENRIRVAVRVVDARKKEAEELEDLKRKQQEFNEDVLGETADTIAGLWEGGKDGLDDTLQYWKRKIIAWLSEMAAKLILSPIIAPIMQSAGLGLGALGSSTGGLGANFGSSGVGGIGNVGSLLGDLGKSLGLVGDSVGTVGSEMANLTNSITGATSGLSDALGGGLGGIGVGATVATLTGGNTLGGSIGGAIGGAIGNAILPGLGGLLGSVAGGFIGSLFGGKPTNATARIDFDENYNRTQVPFSKETAETRAAINSAADQIVSVVQILDRAGATLNDTITAIAIGVRDQSYIVTGSGKTLRSAVGDPNALALTAVKELLRTADFAPGSSVGVVAKRDFGSLEELTSALDFAANVYDQIALAKPALTGTEQAMKSLTEGLKAARKEAEKYGLSVDKLNAGARQLFDFDIASQIQAITDPVGAALSEFERGAVARLNVAKELGADLIQVEKLNALERSRIIEQAAQTSVAGLKSLINDIEFGGLSLGVSSSDQYFSALKAYNEARAGALDASTPESLQAFDTASRALLPIAQSFLGTSTRFAELRSGVLDTARQLGTAGTDAATAAIIAATTQGSAAVVEEVKTSNVKLHDMHDEMKRMNGYLQALFARLSNAA